MRSKIYDFLDTISEVLAAEYTQVRAQHPEIFEKFPIDRIYPCDYDGDPTLELSTARASFGESNSYISIFWNFVRPITLRSVDIFEWDDPSRSKESSSGMEDYTSQLGFWVKAGLLCDLIASSTRLKGIVEEMLKYYERWPGVTDLYRELKGQFSFADVDFWRHAKIKENPGKYLEEENVLLEVTLMHFMPVHETRDNIYWAESSDDSGAKFVGPIFFKIAFELSPDNRPAPVENCGTYQWITNAYQMEYIACADIFEEFAECVPSELKNQTEALAIKAREFLKNWC